ncbi:MAG TPA: NAD(P)H-hydrate dehydratase, partial [Chloroflexota bacterium]
SGRLLAVSGSRDFTGAPAMVSLAAYRAGAGLVEVALPASIQLAVAAHALEPIYLPLPTVDGKLGHSALEDIASALEKARSLALGPGMGLSESTIELVAGVLDLLRDEKKIGAVVDADGLNALAHIDQWHHGLGDVVVTPHPGEMSRLTGLSIAEVQADRLAVARRFASKWDVVVVLKGARTIVAAPDGRAAINSSGGPNLATAGTGDVLSGIIGGLLAQSVGAWDAARCGVYLHGRAGDLLRAELGDAGTLAGDLLAMIPVARQSILDAQEEDE